MTHNFEAADLLVKILGPSRIDSPLLPLLAQRDPSLSQRRRR